MKRPLRLSRLQLTVVLMMLSPGLGVMASAVAEEGRVTAYEVKPGETLSDILLHQFIRKWKIRDRTFLYKPGGPLEQALKLNPEIEDPDHILPGMKVLIPGREQVLSEAPTPTEDEGSEPDEIAGPVAPGPTSAPAPEPVVPKAAEPTPAPTASPSPAPEATPEVTPEVKEEAQIPYLGSEQKYLSLGYTSYVYQETGINPIHASGITLKAGLSGKFGTWAPRWSWGLSGYVTALPLSADRPETSLRFLGLNARIGYLITEPESPWSFRLAAGSYFTTMMVNAPSELAEFGFQNQTGPQVTASLGRKLNRGRQLSGYVKLATIPEGFNFTDLSSRELALGLGYSQVLRPGMAWTLGVDQAWLRTQIESSTIRNDSLSFNVGVIFSDL